MRKKNTYRLLSFAVVCILMLQSQVSFAQWTADVIGTVKKEETKKRMEGAVITIKRNGAVWKTIKPSANGKFEAPLTPDAIYMIEVSKFGHVTKRVEVNTKHVPEDDAKYGFDIPLDVSLFEMVDGLDVSILDKPIGKFSFDPESGYMAHDADYTKSIKKELDRLQEELAERLKAEAENRKANQKTYDVAIAAADKAYNAGKWAEAKPFYKRALEIFPDESYPDFQLADISDKLAELEAANKKYNNAIAKADAALKAREYDKAITSYEYAITLNADEQYPKDKIKEVKTIQSNAKKVEKEYTEAIAAADQLMLSRNYKGAKEKFEAALVLKDFEQYPKDKITEIETILAEEIAKEKEYTDAITEADAALSAKEYDKAVAAYQKALGIKPTETYPQGKIDEAKRLKAEEKQLEENYNKYITNADAAFGSKDYAVAKTDYEKAAALKSEEQHPKDRLAEIKGLLDAAAQLDEEYTSLVKEGDKTLAAKDYEASKVAFEKASGLKAEEQYPKDKLAEIEAALAALAKEEADNKAKEEEYNKLIAEADGFLGDKKYEEAKGKYNEALAVKSEEQYPKDKLTEIEAALAALAQEEADSKAKEEEYNKLVAEADGMLAAKDYENSKGKYNEALAVKAEEQYPKDKLAEIEAALAALAQEEADKNAKEEQYAALITEGDNLLSSKSYEEAKVKYTEALTVKAGEQYPTDKLAEIEAALAEIERLKAEEDAALKAEEERNAAYNEAIAAADKSLGEENYEAAKVKYNEALAVKAGEQYPIDKLKEIEDALAEIARLKAEEEAAKMAGAEKDAKYNEAITAADNALGTKDYDAAKLKYNEALGIKSEEQYPKDKLTEIEAALAEIARLKAEEEAAKLAGAERDAKYASTIAAADGMLSSKDYEGAKGKYNEALAIKSEEQYPKDKLTEIEAALAEIARLKAEAEAAKMAGAEKDAKYSEAIAAADGMLSSKDYEGAKGKYNEALAIKSEEQYPKDKLTEIEAALAEIARLKAEEEAAKLAGSENDKKYQEAITLADNALGYKNYDQAILKYNEALAIKSEEQYPKDKIKEAELAIAALAEDALAAESERKKREYFDAVIAEADAEFTAKNYNEASTKYSQALGVIPGEQYPTDKIKEIGAILAKIEADKANSNNAKAELDKKYNDLISSADNSLSDKSYAAAKSTYQAALALKPAEIYPKTQLSEIEKILAEIAAKENEINITANAQKQKEEDYNAFIAAANNDMSAKQYQKAITNYESALGLIPTKPYPKEKIDEINQLLADIAANEKDNKAELLAEQEKRKKYKKLIFDGDRSMKLKEYPAAKSNFKSALALYGNEQYPKDKLAEIAAKLEELNKPKEIVVSKGTMSGGRAQINNDKEKEIEARMAALRAGDVVKKDERLQQDKDDFNHQEQIRISGGVERTKQAKRELETKEDGNISIAERGNEFHKENSEMMDETTELLERAESNRIKIADRIRAENGNDIKKLTAADAKKKEASEQRAEDMAIDVNEYIEELANAEKILISGSVDRTADNAERIKEVNDSQTEMINDNAESYKLNIAELTDFKERIEELEANNIKRANGIREDNQQINDQYVADIKKNVERQNEKYYDDLIDVNAFKEGVAEQELKNQKAAKEQRKIANEKALQSIENLGKVDQSQEKRYADFKTKLEEEKANNTNFWADLQKVEQEELLLAETDLEGFYMGEKRTRDDNELANKYPQGITEETVESGNSIVIRRIKVTDKQADVFERVFYTWGGTYFYKNGLSITKSLWDKESIE